MAYTIYIKYKKAYAPVFNISFSGDGSVHLVDLLSKHVDTPEYEIATLDFPVNKVGMGKEVALDKKRYFANHRIKFSHHKSGFFQISGEDSTKIISGLDDETGLPKGASIEAFQLKQETNDGGPFMTANIWGIQHLPYKSSSSTPIIFSEEQIDYQAMNNQGGKPAFVLLFFHFPIAQFKPENIHDDWGFYNYHHYKKPLLLRALKETEEHGYIVGISCLKARTNFKDDFGFTMSGGAGKINPDTGTCKNLIVIFPRPKCDSGQDSFSLNKVNIARTAN